jgi:hypothetical protein
MHPLTPEIGQFFNLINANDTVHLRLFDRPSTAIPMMSSGTGLSARNCEPSGSELRKGRAAMLTLSWLQQLLAA